MYRVSRDDRKHERGDELNLPPTSFTSVDLRKGDSADHIGVKYSDDAIYKLVKPTRGIDVDYSKVTSKNFYAGEERETIVGGSYKVLKITKMEHPGRQGYIRVYHIEET